MWSALQEDISGAGAIDLGRVGKKWKTSGLNDAIVNSHRQPMYRLPV